MKRTLTYPDNLHPVIMLCHNALPLTQRAVESVLKQDVPVQLRIVDNHSTDGTWEWLQTQQVMRWQFKPALGVSAAWNFALTDVFRNFDHAVVINNDVELRTDTVRELTEDPGEFVTAVSVGDPAQLEWDGVIRRRPHPDFSCYMIRRSCWEKVGGFDESMVLYASDADYHLRMHQAGIEAYTIGIPFYHYASGTLKSVSPAERARIERQADADRARFEEKWGCRVGSPEYYALFGTGAPEETR